MIHSSETSASPQKNEKSSSNTLTQRIKNWGIFFIASFIGLCSIPLYALGQYIGIPVNWFSWLILAPVLGGSIIFGLRPSLKDYQSDWEKVFEKLADIEYFFNSVNGDVILNPSQTTAFKEWASILLRALENKDRLADGTYHDRENDIYFLRRLMDSETDDEGNGYIDVDDTKELRVIFSRIKKENFLQPIVIPESGTKQYGWMRLLQGLLFTASFASIIMPAFLFANVGGLADAWQTFGLNHFGASFETTSILTISLLAVTALVSTLGSYWINQHLADSSVKNSMKDYRDYTGYCKHQKTLVGELHGYDAHTDCSYEHSVVVERKWDGFEKSLRNLLYNVMGPLNFLTPDKFWNLAPRRKLKYLTNVMVASTLIATLIYAKFNNVQNIMLDFHGLNTSMHIIGISLGMFFVGQLIAYAISEYRQYREFQENDVFGIAQSLPIEQSLTVDSSAKIEKSSECDYSVRKDSGMGRQSTLTDGENQDRRKTRIDRTSQDGESDLLGQRHEPEGGEEEWQWYDESGGDLPGPSEPRSEVSDAQSGQHTSTTKDSKALEAARNLTEKVANLKTNIEKGLWTAVSILLNENPRLRKIKLSGEIELSTETGKCKYQYKNFTLLQYALICCQPQIIQNLLAYNKQPKKAAMRIPDQVEINSLGFLDASPATALDLFEKVEPELQKKDEKTTQLIKDTLRNGKVAMKAKMMKKIDRLENDESPSSLPDTASLLKEMESQGKFADHSFLPPSASSLSSVSGGRSITSLLARSLEEVMQLGNNQEREKREGRE